MIRIAGILLIAMSFSFFVFAHGTCIFVDTDVVNCEILSQIAEPCSELPHTNGTDSADTSVHVCGCVNTFVMAISSVEFGSFSETVYGPLKFNFASSDFSQRIERPPIVPS